MNNAEEIRVAIVDDEPLAREGVRLLLENDPEIAVVAEAGNGVEALQTIQSVKPSLIFLDIQMPEMNGFEVLSALPPAELPAVIFVTAFDRYAIRAFEVHALDYLLKPFDDDRFYDALRRAKQQLRLSRMSDLSQRLISLLASYEVRGQENGPRESVPVPGAQPAERYISRIAIKDFGRVVFLGVEEIDWIEAADYYVQIHAGGKSYLHRESMNSLEGKLDPSRFMRIHRSAIVNRDRVRELRSQGRREMVVVLSGGAELKVARSHRDKLHSLR